jgi:ABC-2 type transport system permease protein
VLPVPSPLRSLPAYWATAAAAAVEPVAEGPYFLGDVVIRVARVLVLLAVWRAVLSGRQAAGGLTLAAVLTYTLMTEVLAEQLSVRTPMRSHLWNGTIATRFLWPMGLVGQLLAESAGQWTWGLCWCSVPLLLAAPLLGVDPRPAGPAALVLFVPSLALGVAVGLAIDLAFTVLVVRLQTTVWLIDRIRAGVTTLLSGALVPLALLPWHLGDVFAWLPFAATASAPLRIYTGTGPAGPLLASQAAWALALWPAVWWLWGRSRERVTGYGG